MPKGRPKKSASLKLAQGNAGRRTNEDRSAKSERGQPEIPRRVAKDSVASEMWEWAIGELDRMGLLTMTDRLAVEMLATDYSLMNAAEKEIDEHGLTMFGEKGGAYTNPSIGVYNAAKSRVRSMMIELGLTPRAREQLNAAPAGEKESGLSGFRRSNPSKRKTTPKKVARKTPTKRKPAKKKAAKKRQAKRKPKT